MKLPQTKKRTDHNVLVDYILELVGGKFLKMYY